MVCFFEETTHRKLVPSIITDSKKRKKIILLEQQSSYILFLCYVVLCFKAKLIAVSSEVDKFPEGRYSRSSELRTPWETAVFIVIKL